MLLRSLSALVTSLKM